MMILYRPVGLDEMNKIIDCKGKRFPERFKEQPIFYPVTNLEYARKIAKDWNRNDQNSGYVGYVTKFEINDKYIENFKVQNVGGRIHNEYWILAEELENFNNQIVGKIEIKEAYYGVNYVGIKPEGATGFLEEDLKKQFDILKALLEYNYMDFTGTVSVEWRIINLNYLFWKGHFNTNDSQDTLRRIIFSLDRNEKNYLSEVNGDIA